MILLNIADIESSRNVHETDAHNSSFLCTKVKRICQVCRPFLSQDYFKRRKKVVCQNCEQTSSFIVHPFERQKVTKVSHVPKQNLTFSSVNDCE